MAWITTKTGKRINTDWFDEDAKQKERQIAENKREASSKNTDYSSIHSHYSQFKGNPSECAMELYKRTGINLTGHFTMVNDDTFVATCATLEDLQRRFHINEVESPEDTLESNNRLEVSFPGYYEHAFEDNFEDVFAHARMCKISLNNKYYSLSPDEFDEVYGEGTEGYTPFHPKGTTSKDILAHESAHHLMDLYVWNKYCKNDDDFDRAYSTYKKVQAFLTDKSEYTSVGESTLPAIKEIFGKFDKVRKKYIKKLKSDSEASRYLGNFLNDNTLLRTISNTKQFGRYGISEYSAKNYHELLAESFADYYANGKQAQELSRMLVKEFFNFN